MHRTSGRNLALPRWRTKLLALATFVGVIGGTSIATAATGRGEGAELFAASFEARPLGEPTIEPCPGLGPDGQKIEGRYRGTMTINGDEHSINFSLEMAVDRTTGVGTAEGHWQFGDPPSELGGRGEFVAVVTAVNPPDPDLELNGVISGLVDPPDPDLPAQRLLGNLAASIEGATFPHLKGTVGDPTGLTSNPAVLVPAVSC